MDCQFRVGQLVVCVDDIYLAADEPKKGRIYEIVDLGDPSPELITLEPRHRCGRYFARRFRPVRTTDISELRRLVKLVPKQETVE